MAGFEHVSDPVEFKVQWCLMLALLDTDMKLCMELLKLPQKNKMQEPIAYCEVFNAVQNAAAHI